MVSSEEINAMLGLHHHLLEGTFGLKMLPRSNIFFDKKSNLYHLEVFRLSMKPIFVCTKFLSTTLIVHSPVDKIL